MPASITVTSLSFTWPDGTPVFEGLDVAFGPGRTGLVGVNGSGKSTLLKLIAGELAPADGTVRVAGEVGYLPQNVTLDTALRVDEALGIADRRAALHAIEAGDVAEAHFETVGDDWDVEERALATLGELGLGHVELDRTDRRGVGRRVGAAATGRAAAAPARRAAAGRADQQPRPVRAQAAVRGRPVLAGRDGRRQPRPRTAGPRRPDRRPALRRDHLVRRQLLRVRGGPGDRTGGGRAHGARRRVRFPQAEARTGRRPGQAGPPQAVRAEDVGPETRAEDRHGGAQARGTGVRGQAPHHARGEARRGQGAARRGGGGRTRRRRDPRRPAVHGRAAGAYRPHPPGSRASVRRPSEGRLRAARSRAGRADRAQRRGQDHAAAHDRRRARCRSRARYGRTSRCGSCRSGSTSSTGN